MKKLGLKNRSLLVHKDVQQQQELEHSRTQFARGFYAVLPIWLTTVPSGIAFTLLARAGHFNAPETIFFALSTFSGSAQAATITLFASNTSLITILITALLINLRNMFYGMSLSLKLAHQPRWMRFAQAFFLTDISYSFTVTAFNDQQEANGSFFLGAGISQYLCYSLAVLGAVLIGAFIPFDTNKLGFDFIFPLMFLSLLVSLLKTWRQFVVAAIAIVIMLISHFLSLGSFDIILATCAAFVGVILEREQWHVAQK